jgi:hypothetical protein
LLTSPDGWSWDLIYQKNDDSVFGDLTMTGKRLARFIRVRLDGENFLHFRKFQVFGRRPTQDDAAAAGSAQGGFSVQPVGALVTFCARNGLDESLVSNQLIGQTLHIKTVPGREFDGTVKSIRLARAYGRFGNVFYQLLSSLIVARRIGCNELQIPEVPWGPSGLPITVEGIRVTGWTDDDADPQLIGCLFAPTGFEPFFADLDFVTDTARNYVRPLYRELFAGVEPLARNVMAMHFRGGDIFVKPEGGHIHNWYVQPPASYYMAAFEYAQRHLGVDSACLVFEDRSNPAVECVERELARHNVPCTLQSADLVSDVRCLLGACHVVRPFGTFVEAISALSECCESFFAFRSFSSEVGMAPFPQSRIDEIVRSNGTRTFLVVDSSQRYIPTGWWTASDEQLEIIRTFPKTSLEVKEITG